MESELCLQPLYIRRRYLASKFLLRSSAITNNLTIRVLDELNDLCQNNYWRRKKLPLLIDVYRKYSDRIIHSDELLQMYSLGTWISNFDISNHIKLDIEGVVSPKRNYNIVELQNICINYIQDKYGTFYKLYTDGSKEESGCGAAFFDPQIDIHVQFQISAEVISIMHCELIAISEALAYMASLDNNNCIILTDSKSALFHLARLPSNLRGHPVAYNILDTICKLRNMNKYVTIQWIPSHVGITGNEVADRAAREAITNGIPYTCLPLHHEILTDVKAYCTQMWREYFDERSKTKGIWYKTIQCQPPRYPWFDNIRIDRRKVISLMRLRSGHIPSNKFKYLMGISSTPNCPECNTVEDVHHLLMECVRNEAQRQDIPFMKTNDVGVCSSVLASPTSEEAMMLVYIYSRITL